MYDYDSFGTLVGASLDMSECLFKTPDIIGNVYRDRDARGRVYDRSGRLLKDEKNYYRYDGEGNLILKSTRNVLESPVMPQPKDWLDKLFTRTTPNDKDLQAHYGWQQGDTAYEWYGNGMLKSVRTPEGATIRFEYDALGRRTLKETHDRCHRYAWDGNVLLHEWSYDRREKPRMEKDELGRIRYDRQELHTNLITWVYDGGSYTPVAKLTEEDSYSIVQDYMGTPIQALDSKGEVVWDCILDIYGDVLELRGKRDFIPFRFQGQYEDQETGLYYNRYKYYDPSTGNYISQDPISIAGGLNVYAYVHDSNGWIDPLGLRGFFTRSIFNAPSGNTHTVYQQKIDWDLPSTGKGGITETNLDRALRGDAPFVVKNGKYSQINPHHSKQNAKGSLFELSSATYQKYYGSNALHPYLPNAHPDNPVNRDLFKIDREAYWKQRAEVEINARKKKGICK